MGSDPIVLPLLRSLKEDFSGSVDLRAVYTQPDKRSGRGMRLQEGPVKQLALELGVPVRQPECMNENEYRWLQENECQLILVMAYGQILKQALLDLPSHGILNFHASILPAYRGASPLEGAISEGCDETGVTLMQIIRELDAGPILDVEKIPVCGSLCRSALADALSHACVPLLKRNIDGIASKALSFVPQNRDEATFTRILTKQDSLLDFRQSAQKLYNRYRALKEWPGSAFEYRGERIRIGELKFVSNVSGTPGTVLSADNSGLLVACGEDALLCLQLQRPGGRMMPVADFLRGYSLDQGAVLDQVDMIPLVASKPFPYRKRNG
ncbi:MAG: methionyl-tRNA formyltransferase [Opitutales bacterium]|nr:methionyl-tRNA formyltransferase [Opitutales bacterium]